MFAGVQTCVKPVTAVVMLISGFDMDWLVLRLANNTYNKCILLGVCSMASVVHGQCGTGCCCMF